jgi:hypothetical protein
MLAGTGQDIITDAEIGILCQGVEWVRLFFRVGNFDEVSEYVKEAMPSNEGIFF